MPTSLNAILVSIVVPSLLELSQSLVSNLIIQLSVCITIVGNQGVEAIFSKAAPSAKISRAKALVRFSRYRAAPEAAPEEIGLERKEMGRGMEEEDDEHEDEYLVRSWCEAGSSEICPYPG
jgi:hypothetical protein